MSGPEKQPAQPEKKPVQPEKKIGVQPQLDEWREKTQKAMDDVEGEYDSARRKIRTPMADFQEAVLRQVIQSPLEKLRREGEQDILDARGALLGEKILTDLSKRRETAVNLAKAYIKRMAAEGGLTAEAVSRMVSDQNRKASRFADLLMKNENHKYDSLVDAMLFSLGQSGESSSMTEAQPKAQKTILEYLNSDLDKPNSDVIQYVWTIFSFMEEKPRLEIAKAYLKGKPADKVEAFLNKGNAMGVFSSEDMKALNPARMYTEDEVKGQQVAWDGQNNYKEQAAKLGIIPYGTENAAGKAITITNAILLFAKFGAGATIVGNFVTGAWQGGKFRGFGAAVKRVTNPQSLAAMGLYAGISVLESSKTMDQLFYGSKEKEEAAVSLRNQKKGNKNFAAWDGFFRAGKNFDGGKVFFDYVERMKKIYDETDVSKLSNYITPADFSLWLKTKQEAKNKPDDKKKSENGKQPEGALPADIDYAVLKDSFDKIKPTEVITFAQIFDTLKIGGSSAKEDYEKYLKEPA
jgi:hypothetical protein